MFLPRISFRAPKLRPSFESVQARVRARTRSSELQNCRFLTMIIGAKDGISEDLGVYIYIFFADLRGKRRTLEADLASNASIGLPPRTCDRHETMRTEAMEGFRCFSETRSSSVLMRTVPSPAKHRDQLRQAVFCAASHMCNRPSTPVLELVSKVVRRERGVYVCGMSFP
jgi:hypothetical protein